MSFMTSNDGLKATGSGRQVIMRKPRRICITLPWSLYQALIEESGLQGRSLSNLACFWLEQQHMTSRSHRQV